jgi:histidinol-phosphate aminotransferase
LTGIAGIRATMRKALEQQIADREGVSPDQIILGEILDSLGLQLALGGGAGGEFIYYRALVDAVALIVGIPLNAHLENYLPSQSSTQTMRETEPDL